MKFSVIIPVYNVEHYINDCLSSIYAQNYGDYEVICINDGSTDNSREILARWETTWPQLRVIDRENGGLSAARNTGLANAKGDYIVFVDSDDWVESNMLSRLNSLMDGTDIGCFACRRTDNKSFDNLIPEQNSGWNYFNHHALETRIVPFVCVWQRCYRHKFLIDNNLAFREGILHEDNEFTPRACLYAKSVRVIPDVLYNYRIRPNSIMTSRGLRSKESLIILANELSMFFDKETTINRTIIYRHLTQCYQMAFTDNSPSEDLHLQPLIDWRCYYRVSRTKLRHRINYYALRISPTLFRKLNHTS